MGSLLTAWLPVFVGEGGWVGDLWGVPGAMSLLTDDMVLKLLLAGMLA